MKKFILIALFIVSWFGCKKPGEANPNITISGVSDIVLQDTLRNNFRVTVSQLEGEHNEITLSVSELPVGLTAVIDSVQGKPPFSSIIRFRQIGKINPGDYTLKILASSSGSSVSQNFDVKVAAFNGWILDGSTFCYLSDTMKFGSYNLQLFAKVPTQDELVIYANDSTGASYFGIAETAGEHWIPIESFSSPKVFGLRINYASGPISGFHADDTTHLTIATAANGLPISVKLPLTKMSGGHTLEIDAHN